MKTAYLCGTITPDPKHLDWREDAEDLLLEYGIQALSPVRGKDPSDWSNDGLEGKNGLPYDNGGFVGRDLRDVKRCDAVLVYFQQQVERQSIGTWVEFGWADMLGNPIIVCSELPEVVKHPFVYKRATRIEPTLDGACNYLKFLLS